VQQLTVKPEIQNLANQYFMVVNINLVQIF